MVCVDGLQCYAFRRAANRGCGGVWFRGITYIPQLCFNANIFGLSRGIDPRYMISKLKPTEFKARSLSEPTTATDLINKVLSLTTVATPHHGMLFYPPSLPRALTGSLGSSFADYMLDTIGRNSTTPSFEQKLSSSIKQTFPKFMVP